MKGRLSTPFFDFFGKVFEKSRQAQMSIILGVSDRVITFFEKILEMLIAVCYNTAVIYLPVAQLDSASDSDSEGRRFKSFRAGQKFDKFRLVEFFIHCESNGISSRFSVYLITEGVYHQPQAVSSFAMMIYKAFRFDDMQFLRN